MDERNVVLEAVSRRAPDSFLNLRPIDESRHEGRGGEMVTMVTMVLSWSRALSVRSGGRPTALFSLFRDTSGRKGGERGCESGCTHTQRTFTDAKMPGVIHASVPRLVLHRALLAPSSLLIVCQSVQQSLARGKGEYGAFLRRIRRADTNRPREISPQRSRNGTRNGDFAREYTESFLLQRTVLRFR